MLLENIDRTEIINLLLASKEKNNLLVQDNNLQAQKIEMLEFELKQLKRAIFGTKSERFIPEEQPEQLNIFTDKFIEDIPEGEENPDQDDDPIVKKSKPKGKKPKRQKIPAHLKRIEISIDPNVDILDMKLIGHEITEKLEMTPVRFFVNKFVRGKYIDDNGIIHIGNLPDDPFPKCIAGTSVVANVMVSKYVDHLPLYRQAKMYKREQVDIPVSTLNAMVSRSAYLIESLYQAVIAKIMKCNYLLADESSIPVLTKDKPGSTLKGAMMIKMAPNENLAVFEYIRTKEKVNIFNSLKDFEGHLQVDGNVSYLSLQQIKAITLMHCLVHSRRKFEQALDYDRERATHVLQLIKKIYAIERWADEQHLDTKEVFDLRQEKTVPILNKLHQYLIKQECECIPSTPIHKAITYMLIRWKGLTLFTTDGKLRPDNNLVENTIRPLALGRKNYMFAGSHHGAQRAAIFYSLFATCLLNKIEPRRWFTDVLNRISEHPINKIEQLIPTKDYVFSDQV